MNHHHHRTSFYRAETLGHALELLAEPGAVPLAGGTDLLVSWRREGKTPDVIVDIGPLKELKKIEFEGNRVSLGPLVTFTELSEHPGLKKLVPILGKAALSVGAPQIRNRGTLGGNIANASAAADLTPVLCLLKAELSLVAPGGKRRVPIQQFLTGANSTDLKAGELIESVRFEVPSNTRMHFEKFGRRNAQAISRLNGACSVRFGSDKSTLEAVRLVIGAATPVPLELPEAQELLQGSRPRIEAFTRLGEIAWSKVEALTGVRASRAYKKPAVPRLVVELLVGASGLE